MPVSKELLDILCCPKCKGDIRLNESKRRAYLRFVQAFVSHKG